MTQTKSAAATTDVSAKWSTATLKAPWFDDERVAGDRSDAAVEAALDNDIKQVARPAAPSSAPARELPTWTSSESSH